MTNTICLFRKIGDSCSYILRDHSENTKSRLLNSGMGSVSQSIFGICVCVCVFTISRFKLFCLIAEHLQFILTIGTESFMGLHQPVSLGYHHRTPYLRRKQFLYLLDVNPNHATKSEHVLFLLYPVASEERNFVLTLQRFVK